MDIDFAKQVRDMEDRGWTLAEIGRAIGRTRQQVWHLKNGLIRVPGGAAAIQLNHLHSTGAMPPKRAARRK